MTTKTYQQSNDVFTSFKIPPAKKMCAPTFPRVPVQKFSETALDNIRRERVERELDSNAKINDNFFINPKKFDALPPKINERPARFLDKEAIMLEQAEAQIKKFAKTESDSTSDYASQLSEEEQKLLKGYEESIQKQKEKEEKTKIDFELSLKETKKRPMDKYIEPQVLILSFSQSFLSFFLKTFKKKKQSDNKSRSWLVSLKN